MRRKREREGEREMFLKIILINYPVAPCCLCDGYPLLKQNLLHGNFDDGTD